MKQWGRIAIWRDSLLMYDDDDKTFKKPTSFLDKIRFVASFPISFVVVFHRPDHAWFPVLPLGSVTDNCVPILAAPGTNRKRRVSDRVPAHHESPPREQRDREREERLFLFRKRGRATSPFCSLFCERGSIATLF